VVDNVYRSYKTLYIICGTAVNITFFFLLQTRFRLKLILSFVLRSSTFRANQRVLWPFMGRPVINTTLNRDSIYLCWCETCLQMEGDCTFSLAACAAPTGLQRKLVARWQQCTQEQRKCSKNGNLGSDLVCMRGYARTHVRTYAFSSSFRTRGAVCTSRLYGLEPSAETILPFTWVLILFVACLTTLSVT
jgi:hypothetical protein